MNESIYKKVIVYGIIVLFIGAGIIPSISGNTEKTSIQLTREAPIGSPLYDDYVNAYWKFNECSGNIVGDSSIHHYNGIKYGPTWVGSGGDCALQFDGVDDYVDLEAHSKALGINKTDDLIYTFSFKSTGAGIMYSATGYKNIPEQKIELLDNGSIMFRVWTALCGISVCSAPGHNDGVEHDVEVIFNGITSDPTVHISVDTNLEGSKTKWLCDIANDEFLNCKFGQRASDDSGNYNGEIDDFKIIKYEQGNKQAPPSIDGPDYGKPNIVYDYTFVTNDPEGDNLEAIYIDWDDGDEQKVDGPFESGEAVVVSHKWTEDGSYDVRARSEDVWHHSPWSNPYNVKIGNQAPSPPDITGPKYGNAQEQLTYTFVSEDYEGENLRYFIEWDDGTTTETGYYASGEEITETHSWGANRDYYIKARAQDNEGKMGEYSIYHIRIGDQPPNKPSIFGSVQGVPIIKYQFAFSSVDPENDNISYDIDWGDGNQESYGPFPSGKTLSLSHAWAKSDTYKVKAQARDIFDYPSGWSEHEIIIPRNKAYNIHILELLFERFPRAFITFRYILGL